MALFERARREIRQSARALVTKEDAVTAAAEKITRPDAPKLRRLNQPWQQEAFGYYNTVGECWYAAQFYARSLAKLRLFPATIDESGQIEPIENPNDPAAQLLDQIQDPGGGRSQLLSSYGRLMFLIGEAYLTVTNKNDVQQWEMLSPNELRIQPGAGYQRLRAPGLPVEQLENAPDDAFEPIETEGVNSAVVYRTWRRHPEYSWLADAPTKAVLNLFEELLLLQLAVRARAKSRAAGAGLLYVAEELSFGDPSGKNDDDPKSDTFLRDLEEAMISPVKDPGSASAVVPMVVRGPARIGEVNAKDALFHIQLHDSMETYPV